MKIIQILIGPENETWQGLMVGLSDEGSVYMADPNGRWILFVPPTKSPWIDVLIKKPPEGKEVLVKNEDYAIVAYRGSAGNYITGNSEIRDVTHWMEIPE